MPAGPNTVICRPHRSRAFAAGGRTRARTPWPPRARHRRSPAMVDAAALAAFSARFQRPVGAQRRPHPGIYAGPELPASWDVFATSLKSVGGALLNAQPSQVQAIQAAIDMGRAP